MGSIKGKVLSPIAYKALMYLIWKWVCGWKKDDEQNRDVSTDVTLSITELGNVLGYRKDDVNRNFARDVRNICKVIESMMSQPLTVYNSKKKKAVTFVWLCHVEYDFKNDLLCVKFTPRLTNYFGRLLTREFTVVKLNVAQGISRQTGVRLFHRTGDWFTQEFILFVLAARYLAKPVKSH